MRRGRKNRSRRSMLGGIPWYRTRDVFLTFKDLKGEAEPVREVRNLSVPDPAGELPVRLYTPEGSGPFPMVIFFHGGG